MAWWKYVPGEARQRGHRAALIPLLVLITATADLVPGSLCGWDTEERCSHVYVKT